MRPAILVFVIALVIVSIPTVLNILPGPIIHDEFSYLLQADTFSHGRLANPPHPHWQFFETMHVLQQPTYASKFPPAQGGTLAAGQLLGDAIYGVIITIALACAAVAWMLRAFMPPAWAVAGGLIAATHPLVFDWAQSFWGGGAAMLGAALFCGALVRLLRRPNGRHGVVLAIGLAILATSRPFEGVLLAVSSAVAILLPRPTQVSPLALARRIGLPLFLVLTPTIGWLAYYNFCVTGSPLLLPDVAYTRQYMAAPRFWWQPPAADREYRNDAMKAFHRGSEFDEYARQTTWRGWGAAQLHKLRELLSEFFARAPYGSILLAPAVILSLRYRRARWLMAAALAVPLAEMVLTPWFRPHYMAVIVPLVLASAMIGLRAIACGWPKVAVTVVVLILLGQVIAVGFTVRRMLLEPNIAAAPKQQLVEQLKQISGEHVVFVRYEGNRQTIFEWVYNSADIDQQRIVFARDLGEQNIELRRFYKARSAWLLTVRGFEINLSSLN